MKNLLSMAVLSVLMVTYSASEAKTSMTSKRFSNEDKIINKPFLLEGTPGHTKIIKDNKGNYYEMYYPGLPENITKNKLTIYQNECLKNKDNACYYYDASQQKVMIKYMTDGASYADKAWEMENLSNYDQLSSDGKAHFDKLINQQYVSNDKNSESPNIKIIKKAESYYLQEGNYDSKLAIYQNTYLQRGEEYDPDFYTYDTKLKTMVRVNLSEGVPYIVETYQLAKK